MRKLGKVLAVAATVAAIGGAGVAAVAQTEGPAGTPRGFGPPGFMHGHGGPGGMHGRGGPGFGDPAARLDALKARLGIRPEQNSAWDGYVKAVRDGETQMRAQHASIDFDKLRTMPWADVQAYMGKLHDQRAETFKAIDAAAKTLLAALDDTQKSNALLPALEHVGPGGWHGGPGMHEHGFGRMGFGPGGPR